MIAFAFLSRLCRVDQEKEPGQTTQTLSGYGTEGYFGKVLKNYATLSYMFFSPNLVWFAVALATYLSFPYDYAAAAAWDRGFVLSRCGLHVAIMLVYFGFWAGATYGGGFGVLQGAQRKFNRDHWPSAGQWAHNVWYSVLGGLQLGVWDAAFAHAYATGKLPHIADGDAWASTGNALRVIAPVQILAAEHTFRQ